MTKISAITYAKLMAALVHGDMDCQELADETGLHYVTVLDYTRALHREKVIRIARWDADRLGRHLIKIYKLEPGKRDASRPRLTQAERQARSRAKKKAAQMTSITAGRSNE